MNEVKIKKFKDPYLKPIILDAVKKIEEFAWFQKKGDNISLTTNCVRLSNNITNK